MPEFGGEITRYTDDPFSEARKAAQPIRLAIDGPSGSGKTFTGLVAASVLHERLAARGEAGSGVAVIDTERGSAALYADRFKFKHVNLTPPFSVARYLSLIGAAAEYGYPVLMVDSLSHGWFAEGGVLDQVDNATARSGGNKWAAWREGTPAQNALISAIVAYPGHVIATMRSAQEWVMEDGANGSKHPRRVGMKPVQRDGVEYEFTFVIDMSPEHVANVSKSRSEAIADRVVQRPGPMFFDEIADWLEDGTPLATPRQREAINVLRAAIGEHPTLQEQHRDWWKSHRYKLPTISEEEADETVAHLEELVQSIPAAATDEGPPNEAVPDEGTADEGDQEPAQTEPSPGKAKGRNAA